MEIDFDPAKDAANLAKHGIALAQAVNFEADVILVDRRADYGEERLNAFGRIEGVTYCLTYTVRAGRMRAISLRRARAKEYVRHVF